MGCLRAIIASAITLGASCAASADTVIVHVYSFEFSINPSGQPVVDPEIQLGDTVRWVFDSSGHSTISIDGLSESWDSGQRLRGEMFEHTFTHTGLFWYYCIPHGFDLGDGTAGGMAGTITVIPAPGTAALLACAGAMAARRRRRPAC